MPSMSIERPRGWPTWAIALFFLGALFLVVGGVISIIVSRHEGGSALGVAAIIVGAIYLIVAPKRWWFSDARTES